IDKAIKYYLAIITTYRPKWAIIYYHLSVAYKSLNNYKLSLKYLEYAYNINNNISIIANNYINMKNELFNKLNITNINQIFNNNELNNYHFYNHNLDDDIHIDMTNNIIFPNKKYSYINKKYKNK